MVWADFKPKELTRETFTRRLAELQWTAWKPKGIVLHNTAAPTLKQWAESGPNHDARIKNLQEFYEKQGWKGGPHWFVSRTRINEFSNPLRRGTHSPTFNPTHFGIEMVGDYAVEDFDSGEGAQVRDNAVFLMAALCRRFHFDPAHDIVFHKEDPGTNHDCPGAHVHKADIIKRVQAALGAHATDPDHAPLPEPAHPGEYEWNTKIYATEFGSGADEQASAYGGMVNGSKPGVALPFKFRNGRQQVALRANGKEIVADIMDVGPWNIDDPYWQTGARPRAEDQNANNKPDFKGRKVRNSAGIDLTEAAMDALMVPGKKGTRSVLLDWTFTDGHSKPVWHPPEPKATPAPEPEVDGEEPTNGNGDHGDPDVVEIEVVQRRLIALGYHEVGAIDGKFKGRTTGAIAAFKVDRGIDPPLATIDQPLKDELAAAEQEGWVRPIAKERKEATEEQIERKAPELAPVKQNRFMAFWGAIGTAFTAAVSALGDNFKEGLSYLTDAKDYLNLVPGWLWLLVIAGVLAFFYMHSRASAAKIADSYRKGERN